MLKARFGIEIEFTGITRNQAAKIAAEHLEGSFTKAVPTTTQRRSQQETAGFGSSCMTEASAARRNKAIRKFRQERIQRRAC